MRVYDVVSAKNQLTEEYEVVPRGKPPNKLFVVIDPESGKELGSYRSPGPARDAARDANAKVQAAADKRKADAEQAEKDKVEKVKKRNRFYRNLKISAAGLHALIAGFSVKVNIDKHIEEQTSVYDAYEAGTYGAVGSPEAIKRYEERSKIIYGAWVSQTAATILTSGAHAVIAAKIINGIKAARAAGMAAGAATLGVGSLIAFILGEAASYAIVWLINKPSTIEAIIEYTWSAPAISLAFVTASKVNPNVSMDPDVEKNLQQALQMDKRKEAGDTATKNNYTAPKPAAAPANSSSNTTNSPQAAPQAAPAASAPPASAPAASGSWAASFLD
jgi:hypothetical protein